MKRRRGSKPQQRAKRRKAALKERQAISAEYVNILDTIEFPMGIAMLLALVLIRMCVSCSGLRDGCHRPVVRGV